MNNSRVLITTLLLLAWAGAVDSTSLHTIGPLAHMDQVSLNVTWGASMGTDEDPGTDLFENERKRRSELETSLLAVAASHLRDGGIQVVKESEDEITFWFNGGKFESGGCPTKNFFMVEIVVCTHEKGCHTEDTVLGVVDDARLPQALTNAAMSSLDEFIGQRAAYRRQTKK